MVSLIGIGDFLFLGLLFGAVRRLQLDIPRTAAWTVVLMTVGLMGVMVWGAALPGLVFIGGAGLVANWRYFRFTEEEKRALLIAAVLLALLLLLGLFWLSRLKT